MSSPRARFQRLAWTLAFAAAVLLKAAVPFLAAGAAAAQGLPVADVCSVYGVRTAAIVPATEAAGHAHQAAAATQLPLSGPHDGPGALPEHGEHCALGALIAFTPAPPAARPWVAPSDGAAHAFAASAAEPARDATARWSALRKQGPPRAG